MARLLHHFFHTALLTIAIPIAVANALQTFELDKKSEVQFRVGILGLFKKSGTFSDMRGELQISLAEQAARQTSLAEQAARQTSLAEQAARKTSARFAKVSAVIRVKSAKMAREADLKLLLSEAYFNVEKFPEIRFESDRFPIDLLKVGGTIRGALTVRGITRTQSFLISPEASCAEKVKLRCPFHAKGSLQRSEFGMTAKKAFVSDKLELDLVFFAEPQALHMLESDVMPQ
jgi:polyisoprenoid-binding protein YceI